MNIKSLLIIGTALLASLSASAGFYTDTNNYSGRNSVTLLEGDTFSDSWNYAAIGSGETITKIQTWFEFSGADDDKEQVRIDIGTGEAPIDFTNLSGIYNFGSSESFNWTFTTNASLFDDASNGVLSYTVKATSISGYNDFAFESAKVEITTVKNSVPEGGATVALLGLSFLGFVGVQRKFRLVR